MKCDKCGCEMTNDDIFYFVEITRKFVENPDIGYPEEELTLCSECGESAMFDLK